MREILFRGKTENGLWRIGYLSFEDKITIKRKCYDYKGDYVTTSIEEYKIDKNTIGQYTGLTDKNGKKIFEGDIVATHGGKSRQVIEWTSWDYPDEFDNVMIGTFMCKDKQGEYFYISKYDEVIGNIHDNPELLGE